MGLRYIRWIGDMRWDWRRQGLERHDVGWRYIRWVGDMRWTGGDKGWRDMMWAGDTLDGLEI